jgi:O-antigen ligase
MVSSPVFSAIAIVLAVIVGIALFSLCRKSYESLLISTAASLIGIVLFISPLVGGAFVGPVTLAQVSFLGMSIAPPLLIGMIALAAGLICLQALLSPKPQEIKLLWPQMALTGAVGLAFLSLLWHWLAVAHGRSVYFDAMLQGWAYLVSLAALLWVIPQVATSRVVFYALLLSLVAGAGVASAAGTQDFLIQLRSHVANPRENATAINPDFFACFLVTTLPLSLALWLAAPAGNGKRVGLLFAFAYVLQFVVLPLTQSRFALIAAPIGFAVFIAGYLVARRRGMPTEPAMKARLIALVVIMILGLAVGARSVLHRLAAGTMAAQTHSGEFRIWTWKGEAKLIEDHLIFGTGPGTFAYAYPRYALVGFAQHAHNSFMQIAGDIGVPGLLCVLAAFCGVLFLGAKALAESQVKEDGVAPAMPPSKKKGRKSEPVPAQESAGKLFLDQVAPSDDRWVLAGLLGGLTAGLIQNLIDSDLYLPLNGFTIVAFAAFILTIAKRQTEPSNAPPRRALLVAGTALCGIVAIGMFWNGIATGYAASGDYRSALGMEPLNGPFASLVGWRTDLPQGRTQDAERMLTLGTQLDPDGVSFNHLADYYNFYKQPEKALAMYDQGLRYDPSSLQLLLAAAQTEDTLGRHGDALGYYNKMVALQQGPYGTVLAITEITEHRYAYADSAVGDQLASDRNFAAALSIYKSAQRVLQTYANEGGSRNPMRLAGNGNNPNPSLDQGLQQLYEHVMSQMETIDEQAGQPDQAAALRDKAQTIIPKFGS